MRTAALKQTPRNVATQVPLFYRPGGVAGSFSMPLYRPFPQRSPPPLSLYRSPPCLSFSPPMAAYIFLSLSTSDLEPIAARRFLSPFFPSLTLYLSPISSCRVLSSLFALRLSFFLLRLPLSPPSDTAVPPLPRADAATRCNVTFIVPFSSFPFLFWPVSFVFLSFSSSLVVRHFAIIREK